MGKSGNEIKRVKRKSGSRPKTLMHRLKMIENMAFGHVITRCQFVSDITKAAVGGTLGLSYSGVTGPPKYQWMPSYMFNLSTLGVGYQSVLGSITQAAAQCGYRQKCTISATDTNWTWESISASHSDPTGALNTPQYSVEKYWPAGVHGTGNSIACSEFIHEWSDIKLMLYGAQQVQTKVHYALVQFSEEGTGPPRIYNSTQYDPSPDALTQNFVDVYWTDWWARKSRNPLISSGMPKSKNIMRVLHHDSVVLEPKTTIDKDVFPNMTMVEHFYHPHAHHSTLDPASVDLQSGNITGLAFNTASSRYGYYTQGASGKGLDYGLFPDYRQNTFLFVWADNNLQSTTSNASVNLIDTNFDPTFDLVIRNKYSYCTS